MAVAYSLKSIPNDSFFGKLFMVIVFALRVFARNLLKKYFCYFVVNPGFTSTYYMLDYSDFSRHAIDNMATYNSLHRRFDLKILNEDKTKYMILTCRDAWRIDSQVTADNYTFETVMEFVTTKTDVSLKIKRSSTLANRCYYGLNRQLSTTKLILYSRFFMAQGHGPY